MSRDYSCFECGEEAYDIYMIHPGVWAKAVANRGSMLGFLHLHCLEKRIGRKLIIADFTDVPCNVAIRFGYALGTVSR